MGWLFPTPSSHLKLRKESNPLKLRKIPVCFQSSKSALNLFLISCLHLKGDECLHEKFSTTPPWNSSRYVEFLSCASFLTAFISNEQYSLPTLIPSPFHISMEMAIYKNVLYTIPYRKCLPSHLGIFVVAVWTFFFLDRLIIFQIKLFFPFVFNS